MIKALLFDLGGTVLAEKSYDLAAGFSVISDYLIPQATFQGLSTAIQAAHEKQAEFSALRWIQENLIETDEVDKASAVELMLWDNTVSLEPIDGVAKALDYLQRHPIRVAAISNAIFSSNCIARELQKHDLLKNFEFIISSADIGIRKPSIEIFMSALKKMDISPKHASYVGDNFEADIIGASAAGMTAIWFGEQSEFDEPIATYRRLLKWSDFKELLDQG